MMKKIEKIGIQAFDVWNNDALVDKMIDIYAKLDELIDAITELQEEMVRLRDNRKEHDL